VPIESSSTIIGCAGVLLLVAGEADRLDAPVGVTR